MTTSTKIDRQMTIDSILALFPHKAEALSQAINNAGLHCIGCHAATWETLEGGMRSHGKTEAGIDALVEKLNILLSQESDPATISFTPRGAAKFLEIMAEEGKTGWALGFDEKKEGCKGYKYILDFSEKALPEQTVFTSHGVDIHVDTDKLGRLLGSEIDYADGLQGSGFKVSNPHAKASCGCGHSHNY